MSRVKAGDAARLLSKMDQLSDEEVTSLLESMLAGEHSAGSPVVNSSASNAAQVAAAAPEVASREAVAGLEAHDELQLLERLEQLSDEEVAALLGEMLAEDESAPAREASAVEGPAAGDGAGRGAVPHNAGEVSVDELSDEEVTRLLSELLGSKGEAE